MSIRVLIFGRLQRLEDKAVFEATFEQVSHTLLSTVDGILRDELICDDDDPHSYIMVSEWRDKNAWSAWQSSSRHLAQVGTLQQYWQGQGVKFYSTVFCVTQKTSKKE